ncbi:uncharacterized protein BO72DRAFT_449086 [Aspergillus fijiensis CBS 313.89]|uniref:Uncharacterized protein n=1 Tax=Aspergillus fijiensis CBS 313.89 TaxID=1448319 RepID=A0A8G1RQY2_9EURO|nr:uncharacterized protein BO72DRAFT_449086 [Aspergillus fijiensis CBS 313.89]RAK76300.1 hypothetical protein BO72DRAFT_449086 [Aspergillus fijiensis CBS 313.89]
MASVFIGTSWWIGSVDQDTASVKNRISVHTHITRLISTPRSEVYPSISRFSHDVGDEDLHRREHAGETV